MCHYSECMPKGYVAIDGFQRSNRLDRFAYAWLLGVFRLRETQNSRLYRGNGRWQKSFTPLGSQPRSSNRLRMLFVRLNAGPSIAMYPKGNIPREGLFEVTRRAQHRIKKGA
jgi:hypothetical protein